MFWKLLFVANVFNCVVLITSLSKRLVSIEQLVQSYEASGFSFRDFLPFLNGFTVFYIVLMLFLTFIVFEYAWRLQFLNKKFIKIVFWLIVVPVLLIFIISDVYNALAFGRWNKILLLLNNILLLTVCCKNAYNEDDYENNAI